MNPAAKLSMLMELHTFGMLCKCKKYTEVDNGDGSYSKMIQHTKKCKAPERMRKLLELQ